MPWARLLYPTFSYKVYDIQGLHTTFSWYDYESSGDIDTYISDSFYKWVHIYSIIKCVLLLPYLTKTELLIFFIGSESCNPEGIIRLVWGPGSWEGNIQICINGIWGWVCHNAFGTADARVVCSQLGFTKQGNKDIKHYHFCQLFISILTISIYILKCNRHINIKIYVMVNFDPLLIGWRLWNRSVNFKWAKTIIQR